MAKIADIYSREIIDSRGYPTVEAEVVLDNGNVARAIVPSGASTGKLEALELRDGGKRLQGKGVKKAVKNITEIIRPALLGLKPNLQSEIDKLLISIDGTENKSKLGANAILAVSVAVAKAAALDSRLPLYRYLNKLYDPKVSPSMPVPMFNIINGGAHADNNVDIQEFMIIPSGADNYALGLEYALEIFYALKKILKQNNLSTSIGDEGGFAPSLSSNQAALDLIMSSIEMVGLIPGKHINLALDCASSEFYKENKYFLTSDNKKLSSQDLIYYYQQLCQDYPIISIEDGMAEDDWDGWQQLTAELGDKIQLVGDDLFVTNAKILQHGIQQSAANSILIKINQIGTLTETFETMRLAHQSGYKNIISHRSGETEDTTISDLSVATGAGQIKTGSVCRGERTAKYNQLLRLNEEVG